MSTNESFKSNVFPFVISGCPMIALKKNKLHGATNDKSWVASMHLWFKGRGI